LKGAVLRQQHQVELAWSVRADGHRLKTCLFISVGEGENRIVVREVVVEWEF